MNKKLKLLIILFILLMIPTGCVASRNEQTRFDDYTLNQFLNRSSQDTMTLHFTLSSPDVYGLDEMKQTLGELSVEAFNKQTNELQTAYEELKSFNTSLLTNVQKRDYRIYEDYLELEIKQSSNQTFNYLFTPDGLIHILSTNFLEYRFNSEEDVENYLFLLSDIQRYLNSAMKYTHKQALTGIFISDFILDQTIETCHEFLNKGDMHPLLLSFEEKISHLNLNKDKAYQYIDENRRIMNEVVTPVIDSITLQLNEMKGSSQYQRVGMARIPTGREAYALMVQQRTGLKDTPIDIFNDLNKAMVTLLAEMSNLLNDNPNLSLEGNKLQIDTNPVLLLNQLKLNSSDTFPSIPEVTFNVEMMDESMASDRVLAYFMPPPIDDIYENAIKVNARSLKDDPLQLYNTLAHEGYPGHLYQNTYFMNHYTTPLRTSLNYLGYVEGWAKFIENEMLNYIPFDSDSSRELAQLNANYGYYLQSACDLGVNDQGWNIDELAKYLSNYGVNDKLAVQQIYDSVIAHPSSILPYGVGAMKMEELKQRVQFQLKDKYIAKEFYQVVLDCGPAPFFIVEEDINAYLNKK